MKFGFFILGVFVAANVVASQLLIPSNIVSFETPESQRLLSGSSNPNFEFLSQSFIEQPNFAYCAPTSAAIVINALHAEQKAVGTPYTSETFFSHGVAEKIKTPAAVTGDDPGMTIDQFADGLRLHDLNVAKHQLKPDSSYEAIHEDLIDEMRRPGHFVIANYLRSEVGESGFGHFSPLAAYNEKSDMFLVLDTNRKKHPWTWISSMDLIKSMSTNDFGKYRGYLTVTAPAPVHTASGAPAATHRGEL